MIPGKKYTLEDVVRIVWRRRWWILLPFVIVTSATIVVSTRLPDRFRAEALIVIVPQSVSSDYVRETVTSRNRLQDRLPSIAQQILTRSRLEPIILNLDLYAGLRRTKPMDAIVDQMKRDIRIDTDRSESFRVSYEADRPVIAKKVTDRIAALFVDETLRDREVLAQTTSAFLSSQLEDARRRLEEQEKKLEAYRLRYGPELPTQLASNMQVMQNTQIQIQSLDDSLSRDRDGRLLLQRQLADLQSEQFLAEPAASTASLASVPISALALLERARDELTTLELRLTPEHPDVVRQRQAVLDLEQRVKQESSATAAHPRTRPLTSSEIAKLNKVKELQAQLESVDRQIANKSAQQAELRETLRTYQARVEAVPTRESELASLTRDYDTLRERYRTLLNKREDSKVAEQLVQLQAGELFKVADPPRLPERPFLPNRRVFNLEGALAGLTLGVALAALLELLDKSLKVEADVQAVLPFPVLALVPALLSGAERRRARLQRAAVSVGLAVVVAACAAAVWLTVRI